MTLVRRYVLWAVGGWSEWCITEDAELGLRVFEAGYEALYIPQSYGAGLMPDTFIDYKRQRFRWAYGAMQILRHHATALLRPASRIPGSFSPRSPQHRKDLAASMRNRLDSAGVSHGGRLPRGGNGADTDTDAAGTEVAELRRRLRRHPCHDCPDREEHARYAERYRRLRRETEALERRMAGRSHVIARTFDRVCAVLERLGYLAGDTVTPPASAWPACTPSLTCWPPSACARGCGTA